MSRKLLSGDVEHHQSKEAAQEARWQSKATGFYRAHQKALLFVFTALLIIIPIVLAVWFRSYTYSLPITEQWAQSTVDANVRNAISAQVSQQFPNLPASNKQQLVDQEYTKFMAANGASVAPQIAQTAAYFRSQLQDSNGHTLLPDIDTYYNLLKVEQIVKNGYPGDKVVNGTPWNMHMLAPIGVPSNWDAYTTFVAYLYKFLKPFEPGTTPMYTLFWVPLLFASLAIIPAFFLGRREGLFAGFFAAVLLAVHPAYITQSAAGYASTHVLQLFFPITIAWFFIEAFEASTWLKRGVYLLLMGLFFGLFAMTWGYWWFFFDVFLIVVLAYLAYQLLHRAVRGEALVGLLKDKDVRWSLVMLAGLIIVNGLFISLFVSPSFFIQGPGSAFAVTADFKAAAQAGTIWPNVMTTVAELNEPSIATIISSAGGTFLFLLGLMGMLFTMVHKKRLHWKDWTLLGFGLVVFLILLSPTGTSLPIIWFLLVMALPVAAGAIMLLKDDRGIDMKYAIFLAAWLGASIFVMTKGVRFIIMVLPPLILGAAIAIGVIYALMKEWLVGSLGFSRGWVIPALLIILSLPLVPIAVQGNAAGQQSVPIITKPWYDTLTNIKTTTAPDAIINSWWDFGHWFKEVADRRVTFDGASQLGSLAHWIGKALLTADERESVAILRMVDCGSDTGTTALQAALPSHDQYEAIMLTKQLILLPLADAHQLLLSKGLSEAQAQDVLNLTHCAPPDDYFITSGDMVGKAGVWGHFGSWDFAKADAYENFRTKPQAEAVPAMEQKYNWSADEASKAYYDMQTLGDQNAVNAWIAPWPGYLTGSWVSCANSSADPTLLLCQMNVQLSSQQGQNTILEGLAFNTTQPNSSFLAIGFYDSQGNKLGANNDVKPGSLVLVTNATTRTLNFTGNTFGQAFVVDLEGKRAMMVDPLHADSMFFRLFFLDGKGTTAFDKFSDQTDFMGTRIIVWKVDWSRLQALGIE